MPGSLETQYIRLEGESLHITFVSIPWSSLSIYSHQWKESSSCGRIPAGFYISINVNSCRRWKSAISVLSSDESVVWGDSVTLSSHASPALSVEIRASYELGRMLGGGEVIGELQMSWDELIDHGDLSFPHVRGVQPFLALKAAVTAGFLKDTDAGHARLANYIASANVSHLNAAVEHFQLVLDQRPVSHPDHAAALTNLAYARFQGYIRNDLQDIDSITSLFRDALALRSQRHPDRPYSLYNLTLALTWYHNKKSTAADIREAAQLYHELLPLCSEGTCLHSIAAGANGVGYVIEEYNDLLINASDEDIHFGQVILELCPLGHELRPRTLDSLSWALRSRFRQHGSIDDLNTSIQLGRDAMSLCPERHADRDFYLDNLALSLVSRFHHQGKPSDLNEAISLYEEALCLCPVGHESRDYSLDSLGSACFTCFFKRGDTDALTRAINLYREVLMLRPPGHPRRDITLCNLALALQTRYEKLHLKEDLNEAIDLYRESLRLMWHDHSERHVTIYGLSSVLCSRFTQTQENEDVEEAITLCQGLLAALSPLHPDRYLSYMGLQEVYLSRYQILHDHADLSLAMENFRLASRYPTQGFRERIITAQNWVTAAEQYSHTSAPEAYDTCFDLGDYLATRSTLPVDAASCPICCHNLRHAVEFVEHGCDQQWSLASRLRTPVEDLESANPTLVHNYLELSKHVSNAAQSSATITDRAAANRAATEYRRLTEQWAAAVVEIRDLRAFSRSLLPPLYENLQAASILAHRHHRPNVRRPRHVPLPSVTLAELTNLKDRFVRVIRHASIMGPKVPRNDLIVLLRAVRGEIMLPIVNVLQHDPKLEFHSRIWLCPTAAFTSIPLHAVHPFKTKADGSKEPCLEDIYVCSHMPTLSALVRSRQMMKKRVTPSFVTIGRGKLGAGKGKELLAVDSGLELVYRLVPATANRTTISGDAATRAGALEALRRDTWVHLARHGKQDLAQPYNSHFVMKDKHLMFLDIIDIDILYAEFAFLSVCCTTVGDDETPDEVIHLVAGLQFSGFKSIIGTLREVDDSVAKHVVEAFYKYMFNLKEGLYEGGLGTQLCYARSEDKNAT
ncbi:CHAT domain-containing protein [Suillus subaureus]|uniref:CHAT domain-containing protein n=1 Tax=Suillus subaureus TaxID=48587 RepID=A0A9P7EBR1_9AGAM|nr:CHAT domain-containing protein [Suillus subaureus]KAG1816836.1 CHAT domain-containing protein [Suillus subaureus]